MIPKVRLPAERRMTTLEVRAVTPLSDSFVRLTLGGPELKSLVVTGGDQAVRLFFPRPGQPGLRMPTRDSEAGLAQTILWPKSTRPYVRNMTVRAVRPEVDELDIEIAVHGDTPMSTWVRSARPGDPAGIWDMGATYDPPPAGSWQLLVADETALPAVAAILEGASPGLRGEAFVEVPYASDVRPDLVAPPGVTVRWFPRDGGAGALDALRAATLPGGPFTAWTAGESKLATGVRRHLVNDRGVAKRDIAFIGYWRVGRSSPG
ncbi:siderophore-interacting protein [Actinoplanes couchii]|uniref:Siderophore-interacting protein n=1 Tax=Actinoplanes couchii TaxID=403638 RepID=A0ABQ3XRD5_9ACTN|nr:siderophore-interacting protein [Actinoplanes couchii]MDR6320031.1 NADPH-dependent ferric siderophore reductase [Actinoplanes couchii]GID61071.1 siderophore-interacting protein [Actinoplanes couchii]